MPQLRETLNGEVDVIDFGNMLDEASMRMVREVVDEIQDRKALAQPRRSNGAGLAGRPP